MDIRSKFSFNIPEALIEALGITVDIESENDAWYEEG